MLKQCGYPGMKVLEFAFDSRDDGDYRPHSYPKNCIAYVGTHDNEPVNGGWKLPPLRTWRARALPESDEEEGYHWGMMARHLVQCCRSGCRAGTGSAGPWA